MKSMRSIFCLLLAAALCLSAAIGCAATLTLPANLRAIEAEAFCGDTSLDEVVLPEGLETIGSRAFAGSSVSVINLPDSIEAIDEDAFENCENVSVMVEIGTYAFDWAKAADLSIIPIAASEDDFVYTSSSKGITITEYTGNDKHIVIPEKIKNKKVIAIDSEWLVYNIISYHIKSVWIPSTVSSIEAGAFDFCKELEEINIYGNNTTYFSKDGVLFNSAKKSLIRYPEGKQNITTYIVPDEIQIIGDSSFYSNKYIKQVVLSDNITSIGEGAFIGCDSLEDINIPDGITELIDVFRSCKSLKNVKIPDSVVLIGDDAFAYCESLTNIVIPSSVKEIGFFAFAYCSNLLSIEIPASVQKIGDYAFIGSSDDFAIYGEAGSYAETYAEENSFPFVLSGASNDPTLPDPGASPAEDFKYKIDNDEVTITRYIGSDLAVVIPSVIEGCSVTSIGDYAFNGFPGLTSITIPDSVTSIGEYAFSNCSGLTSITIPDGVTGIGYNTFNGCTSLTNITIPDSVKGIGDCAFYGCSGLTSIKIPDNVTSIGKYAFSNCSGLTSVTIPDSVTSIKEYVFASCSGLTSITIPDGVTSIGKYAFSNCSGLTSITIPDSVTSIGSYAFNKCRSLTSIAIPDGVTSIGDYTFSYCSSLMSITIPNSVMNIGSYAFYSCSRLTSITIPNSVTSIGSYAFYICSRLTSITISDSVTSIGGGAFSGCFSLTIYGVSGSYAETYAAENGIPFIAGEIPEVTTGYITVQDYRINNTPNEITVNEGDVLSFSGTLTPTEGATISAVQVSIYDTSVTPLGKSGAEYFHVEGLTGETYDLSGISGVRVGEEFGASGEDQPKHTMTAGNTYAVMLYATDSNGNSLADTDPDTEEYQGPMILVHVEKKDEQDFVLGADTKEVSVPMGTILPFGFAVSAPDGAMLTKIRVHIYNNENRTNKVLFAIAEDINASEFDLSAFDPIVVGKTYSDESQSLVMESGKSYEVTIEAYYMNEEAGTSGISITSRIQINVTEAVDEEHEHEPSTTEEVNYLAHIYEPIDSNNYDHTVAAIIWETICDVCGETFEYRDETGYEGEILPYNETHNYNETGYCLKCGYICDHNYVALDEYKDYSGAWENCGDGTHKRLSVIQYYQCTDCGAKDPVLVTEENFVPEPHTKRTKNYCIGYEELAEDDALYWTKHKATYEKWAYCSAKNQGCDYEELIETFTVTEDHKLVDSVCACGIALWGFNPVELSDGLTLKWKMSDKRAQFVDKDGLTLYTNTSYTEQYMGIWMEKDGVQITGSSEESEYLFTIEPVGISIIKDGRVYASEYIAGLENGNRWTAYRQDNFTFRIKYSGDFQIKVTHRESGKLIYSIPVSIQDRSHEYLYGADVGYEAGDYGYSRYVEVPDSINLDGLSNEQKRLWFDLNTELGKIKLIDSIPTYEFEFLEEVQWGTLDGFMQLVVLSGVRKTIVEATDFSLSGMLEKTPPGMIATELNDLLNESEENRRMARIVVDYMANVDYNGKLYYQGDELDGISLAAEGTELVNLIRKIFGLVDKYGVYLLPIKDYLQNTVGINWSDIQALQTYVKTGQIYSGMTVKSLGSFFKSKGLTIGLNLIEDMLKAIVKCINAKIIKDEITKGVRSLVGVSDELKDAILSTLESDIKLGDDVEESLADSITSSAVNGVLLKFCPPAYAIFTTLSIGSSVLGYAEFEDGLANMLVANNAYDIAKTNLISYLKTYANNPSVDRYNKIMTALNAYEIHCGSCITCYVSWRKAECSSWFKMTFTNVEPYIKEADAFKTSAISKRNRYIERITNGALN